MLFSLLLLLAAASVSAQLFPCNLKACSQLGEACDCLSQICCDASLSCVGGTCTGVPSVGSNDQIQQDFPSSNPSLSYTGIFQESGRYITREVYDAYSYPKGPLEPNPFRIFQVHVEIGSPAPCCAACSLGASTFGAGTNTNCYGSRSCVCDPLFYQYANCSIAGVPQGPSCPAYVNSTSNSTSAPASSARLSALSALIIGVIACLAVA